MVEFVFWSVSPLVLKPADFMQGAVKPFSHRINSDSLNLFTWEWKLNAGVPSSV